MQLNLGKIKTSFEKVDTDKLIGTIKSGKAILFTGAGFSAGSFGLNGAKPLGSVELSHAICKLGGFPQSDNLQFSSDYFISRNNPEQLIDLLRKNYTITTVSQSQELICALNWRRFYTTNYDRTIEIAAEAAGKRIETIDVTCDSQLYYKKGGLCIHVNGSIDSLDESSITDRFKLSSSSYISPNSFLDSDWFYYFKKDLEKSSAIVFIGYSMYDIDIQKILFQDDSIRNKTYFITKENPELELSFTLERFGKVLPIGTDAFAEKIKQHNDIEQNISNDENIIESFRLYEFSDDDSEVKDNDVENMLMYGDVSDNHIDYFMLGKTSLPFLVQRDSVYKTVEFLTNNSNVLIYSALGNGKSIFIKEVRTILTLQGVNVYELDDSDGDYILDIDLISKGNQKSVILIDGYEKHLDILEHIARSKPGNITVLTSSRISEHEYNKRDLQFFGFEYKEICVDILTDTELRLIIPIIDNLGTWGDMAGSSLAQKIIYLKKENDSQLSLLLLSILNSPYMRSKVVELTANLKGDKKVEAVVFSICLCKILDIEINKSIISELSDNEKIYESDFLQSKEFKTLFGPFDGINKSMSSLFGLFIIKSTFSPTFMIERLLFIAERFNKRDSKDFEQEKIFKSVLKFSVVERILPSSSKIGQIQRYYKQLKVVVPWLTEDSHFWLQYAMSYIAFEQYDKAQQYLNEAYSIARKKQGYHTDNIDTQQAKLYLLAAEKIADGRIVYDNFTRANALLSALKNDVYKVRQVLKYKNFYDSNYKKLSKSNKVDFLYACQNMLTSLKSTMEYEDHAAILIAKAVNILDNIIEQCKK
ncbi:SIR2 family protein [Aeromonas hydrophila]